MFNKINVHSSNILNNYCKHSFILLYVHVHAVVGKDIYYRIGAVADRDENSKLDDVTWGSFLKTGTLIVHSDHTISVRWDNDVITLKSHISEKGRGVELSELIVFNGKLYTIDDRSGIGKTWCLVTVCEVRCSYSFTVHACKCACAVYFIHPFG